MKNYSLSYKLTIMLCFTSTLLFSNAEANLFNKIVSMFSSASSPIDPLEAIAVDGPSSLLVTETYTYVCNFSSGTISVINPVNDTLVKTIDAPSPDFRPYNIAYIGRDANNNDYAYVASLDSNFGILNLTNQTIILYQSLVTQGLGYRYLAVDTTNSRVFFSTTLVGKIDVYDTTNPSSPSYYKEISYESDLGSKF